jgi:hypothetical protein
VMVMEYLTLQTQTKININMKSKNANIFVSSVNKISKKLEFYGDANLENISLLRLIYKYLSYAPEYSYTRLMEKMIAKLQKEDGLICLERESTVHISYSSPIGVVSVGASNARPTLGAASITVGEEVDEYTFTYADLFSGYYDDAGGTPSSFVISQLPLQSNGGKVYYDGIEVVAGQLLYDATKLTYTRGGDAAYSDYFNFYANDDNTQLPLSSSGSAVGITVEEKLIENVPPTIDDVSFTSENRFTTVFTSASFSSYNDVDGDNLGAIKILSISTTNRGDYMFQGAPVVVGQIITVEQMDVLGGSFYHLGPDENALSSDTIEVAVRARTGDQSWVE